MDTSQAGEQTLNSAQDGSAYAEESNSTSPTEGSGSNYDKIPDAVGLQPMAGNTTIKLVGELKVPWVIQHDLGKADRRPERELRQKIAQPVRDMQALDCEYGFITNPVNNQTARWVVGFCSDVAKAAILGYAKRNKIYHGGPGGLGDSETRDAIASNVKDLEKFLPDYQRAHRHLWVRIVKLWKKCGRYMEDVQKSAPKTTPTPDSSRLLAAPPRTAEEKEVHTSLWLESAPRRQSPALQQQLTSRQARELSIYERKTTPEDGHSSPGFLVKLG
ncbi:hypothetical protein PCH_Pc12g06800 [Penicillium rubens Wisconsin 54-1255]|uniref:Uncharacterized protein n=1 Tax=Penicillium rubens (strain ATCC 28089 / DSM 1075 / NRRL 1951 / Wisconsin 54-1255) TaxID=500485 RepID=B6H0P0_PENRW|nr:hypothetical protein PCH_Pc12g06800 [Penicillium rubens Wisconsin 54-1255]